MTSPYENQPYQKWGDVTQGLVKVLPLSTAEIVEVVLAAWDSIFASKLGKRGFRIGRHIFPKPQIMGFLLHELIPLEIAARHPKKWRGEQSASEKDIVYTPDDHFSIEVKTSSNPTRIFGNRSYGQRATADKKAKSGYHLAVNFEKFSVRPKRPSVLLVRFGWLDSSDWIGQEAPTGQQSHLSPEVEKSKLLELYKLS
ncbi:MAG TPA: ScaI family restriction endonuclease [Blastocatellia bacterium]|nr:ScaI family restriction endonuclease [Blastocatellia bacterium]